MFKISGIDARTVVKVGDIADEPLVFFYFLRFCIIFLLNVVLFLFASCFAFCFVFCFMVASEIFDEIGYKICRYFKGFFFLF